MMKNLTEAIPIKSLTFLNRVGETQLARLEAPYPGLCHLVIQDVDKEPVCPHTPK